MYLECKTKRMFAIACLEKKLGFHTEISYGRSMQSGQKVVQFERNLVWSIPCAGRVFKLSATIRLLDFTLCALLYKIAVILVFISYFQVFVYGSDLA